ncbi:cysteine-rich RECEPTOR-like kinase [Rhynchospora pubera]|uniref:Cysteine-rich RECEPTOR-like kinase n=1 Tax=Rhynchospora pubera TaxID=906938 RepID=A0AAV8BSL4_9POAL|nr:cysteine-rich RECEPTOR-like kinase [Rhynchospora pubera]
MQNMTLLLLYSLFLTNLLKLLLITSAQNSYLYTIASNDITFNENTYICNLRELASSLSVNASAGGYSEQTVGVPPDQVFGVVLCRGDINVSNCTGCIDQAYGYMTNNGSSQIPKSAVIWYDYCLFQYSNEPINPTDNSLRFLLWNNQNFTDQKFNGWNTNDVIMSSIHSTLSDLLTNVSEHTAFNSEKRFATGMTKQKTLMSWNEEANITVKLPEIYGSSQCIPSFSNNTCRTCLQDLIDELLGSYDGSQGGRIVGVKCDFRYEIYPFFSGNPDIIQLGSVPNTHYRKQLQVHQIVLMLSRSIASVCCCHRPMASAFFWCNCHRCY